MARQMTGAEMVVEALKDQGVDTVFGYPGGAVLPIYDALFHQNFVRHVLVRHEQGAGHAAEGYARSTGKVGVLLVTSGPGATNAVTALTDALLDSDAAGLHHRPGADPPDRLGCLPGRQTPQASPAPAPSTITSCGTIEDLPRILHEAFYVASQRTARPGRHRRTRRTCSSRPAPTTGSVEHARARAINPGRRPIPPRSSSSSP